MCASAKWEYGQLTNSIQIMRSGPPNMCSPNTYKIIYLSISIYIYKFEQLHAYVNSILLQLQDREVVDYLYLMKMFQNLNFLMHSIL